LLSDILNYKDFELPSEMVLHSEGSLESIKMSRKGHYFTS